MRNQLQRNSGLTVRRTEKCQRTVAELIHFTVADLGYNRCKYVVHIVPEEGYHLIGEQRKILNQMHQETMKNLKAFAENGFQLVAELEAS